MTAYAPRFGLLSTSQTLNLTFLSSFKTFTLLYCINRATSSIYPDNLRNIFYWFTKPCRSENPPANYSFVWSAGVYSWVKGVGQAIANYEHSSHYWTSSDCYNPSGGFVFIYLQETACGAARDSTTKRRFTMNKLTPEMSVELRDLKFFAVFYWRERMLKELFSHHWKVTDARFHRTQAIFDYRTHVTWKYRHVRPRLFARGVKL